MTSGPRALLRAMFDAAVAAALPEKSVPLHLPPPPKGRTVVIGAGKASAAMARALEDHWAGPLTGLVVTRYGHAVTCQRIEIVEAAHPVPDAKGRDTAARILQMVQGLTEDDLVIALISGGGSSLLSLPAPGLTLEDKQAVNRALLRSGAHIGEMNTVRKHLSAIKGGRLAAAAAPAQVVTLVISYVPADDPAIIASGPTIDIARVGYGVIVRAGAPKPDISTPDAFKKALLDAKSIASVPASAAGAYIAKVYERLGIGEDRKAKTRVQSGPTAIAPAVAKGEAELGIFLTNVFNAAGVELVGPFPADLQQELLFASAIAADAKETDAAQALIDYLKTPAATAAIKAAGMTPG